MAARVIPNEMMLSFPWMVDWLAEIDYQPEQVKHLDVESEVLRDFEKEKHSQGTWKVYKVGKTMLCTLSMNDGSKHCIARDMWR